MILGAHGIARALRAGHIVCDPAPATVTDAHIDVHLGEWVWVPRRDACLDIGHADPRDCYTLVEATDGHVILPPGVSLGHTMEYVGSTVPWLLPVLHTRSTLARWGLSAHQSAGLGDAGFHGRWTLEIANPWPSLVAIPVGARVASITFALVQEPGAPYQARYHAGPDTWTPDAMLPRMQNW